MLAFGATVVGFAAALDTLGPVCCCQPLSQVHRNTFLPLQNAAPALSPTLSFRGFGFSRKLRLPRLRQSRLILTGGPFRSLHQSRVISDGECGGGGIASVVGQALPVGGGFLPRLGVAEEEPLHSVSGVCD